MSKIVSGREVSSQRDPSDEMVWAICPWLRTHQDGGECKRCPRWEERGRDDGPYQRGCYALAKEACKVVFAMQRREGLRKLQQLGQQADNME